MPEYSEVKIIVNQLNKEFGGHTLHNVEIVGGKFIKTGIQGIKEVIFPLHNVKFNSHGKFIYWTFNENVVVFNHLGMAANFGDRNKHSAIKYTFGNRDVFFNDIRHFGNFKFASKQELQEKLSSLGWDLMTPIPNDFIERVRKHNRKTVAEAMMNQSIFSGSGNYTKSESCYDAKINPLRTVESLTDEEIIRLCKSLQKVVENAYKMGGATISTFKDMYGNSGKFFDKFQIYGKKIDPLGNPISKVSTKDGRSTFIAYDIQK